MFGLLSYGSKGTAVETLQQLLVDAGYSVGPAGVDGDFGTSTRSALLAFQKDHGLTPNGTADDATMDALLGLSGQHRDPTTPTWDVGERERRVNAYSAHLSEVLAKIQAAPGAAAHPDSVHAATAQMNQWNEFGFANDIATMSEKDFAEYLKYGDDVNQAMYNILDDLSQPGGGTGEHIVVGPPSKIDVGKLVAGLAAAGVVIGVIYWLSTRGSRGLVPATAGLGNADATVARMLNTPEWEDSTAVDLGDVVEIRHASGAVARIAR